MKNCKSLSLSLLTILPKGAYSIVVMKMVLWCYWNILNIFWCLKLSRVEGFYQSSWLVISLFSHIAKVANHFSFWSSPWSNVLIFYYHCNKSLQTWRTNLLFYSSVGWKSHIDLSGLKSRCCISVFLFGLKSRCYISFWRL